MKKKGMLKDIVHSSPLAENERQYPAERVDAPHVKVQVVNIAKIQDQVPGTISTADSEDRFGLTSKPNRRTESCGGCPRHWGKCHF